MLKVFPYIKQSSKSNCGATCLLMLLECYGASGVLSKLTEICNTDDHGASVYDIENAGNLVGFETIAVKLNFDRLLTAPFPLIVHFAGNHFVVLCEIVNDLVYVADPVIGLITYPKHIFKKLWYNLECNPSPRVGIAILVHPKASTMKRQLYDVTIDSRFFVHRSSS